MIATRLARAASGRTDAPAPPTPRHRPAVRLASALALALVTVLGTVGCSGLGGERAVDDTSAGSGQGAETGGSRAEGNNNPAPERAQGSGSSDSADESDNKARPVLRQRAIIRTGTMDVVTKRPRRAADQAEKLVTGTDGYVAKRTTDRGDSPGEETTVQLTLRVPVDGYGAARKAISDMGKVTEDRHQAKDVTDEMVDVESRIHNQERSIERLRKLMSEAEKVEEVIRIESELQRREADLESLQARQQKLSGQTSLSTIDASFTEPDRDVPEQEEETPLGFLTGLRNGTDALLATGAVVLTVFGAVAPFLVILLALGAPATWLALRWRRHRAAQDTSGTSGSPPAPAPQPDA